MSLTCELYFNKSDNKVLRKRLEKIYPEDALQSEFPIEITADSSVVNPTFKLASPTNVMEANYMRVKELGRFYYINDKVMTQGYLIISAHVDVLMSYAEEIEKTKVIADRTEYGYNMYLNDNMCPIEQKSNVRTIEFPGGFQEDTEFILIMAGGEAAPDPDDGGE